MLSAARSRTPSARITSRSSVFQTSNGICVAQRHYSKQAPNKKGGPLFDKILIANRGEIACRVIRTARKLGIKTVAVFSDADRNAMHVQQADEAYHIGAAPSKESYLRGERILEVAKRSKAQGIHPGYGFLSENAGFADLCEKSGVVFIGPPSSAIRAMGSKSESKNIMSAASVPLIPGYHGRDQSPDLLMKEAAKIGYPVLIKAVLGGGGKGMRIVHHPDEFPAALQSAKREALSSFSDDNVLIEKYIVQPRHVELQVFADHQGNAVYLFERDCSVQRRHQKIIEEAPAPGMTEDLRREMGIAAVNAAKAVGYVGAGTVEFIMDSQRKFYFMEMNTRLQVEHPITEMITGQDLVEWQLKVAAGHPLPLTQEQLSINGHAFEARIYAENPNNNFLPGTGKLVHLSTPAVSPHVRIDTGVREGDEVKVFYDPMIAKLVVHDVDRTAALRRLRLALQQYRVSGLTTNIAFLSRLASHPEFVAGNVETGFIEKHRDSLLPPVEDASSTQLALATLGFLLHERQQQQQQQTQESVEHSPFLESNGLRLNHLHSRRLQFIHQQSNDVQKNLDVTAYYHPDGSFSVKVPNSKELIKVSGSLKGEDLTAMVGDHLESSTVVINNDFTLNLFSGDSAENALTLKIPVDDFTQATAAKGSLLAPMPGRIVQVLVKEGQAVRKGDALMILEAMKMEHTIRSPVDGVVEKLNYNLNELVEEKKQLLSIKEEESKASNK